METIEVRSKSYVIKWVDALENSKIHFEIKPLKKSINFAIYTYKQSEKPLNNVSLDSPTISRKRSITVGSTNSEHLSLELKLENANLIKHQDLGRLNGDELTKGEISVKKANVYAFVFDNTFSKTTGKKVLFVQYADHSLNGTGQLLQLQQLQLQNSRDSASIYRHNSVASEYYNGNSLGSAPILETQPELNRSTSSLSQRKPSPLQQTTSIKFDLPQDELRVKGGKYIQGFLLKKKRKKTGKNFNKRYFTLNFKYGILNYYLNDKSKHVRGNMFIKYVGITADPKSRVIVLDSGLEIWTLKALTDDDLQVWVDAFNRIKKQGSKEPDTFIEHSMTLEERELDDFSINDDLSQDIVKDLEILQYKFEDMKKKSELLVAHLKEPTPTTTPTPVNSAVPGSLSRKLSVSSISTQRKSHFFGLRRKSDKILESQTSTRELSPSSIPSGNSFSPVSVSKELHEELVECNNMVLQLISQHQYRLRNGNTSNRFSLSRGSAATTAANSVFSQEFYDANEYVNELNSGVLMINNNDSELSTSRDDSVKLGNLGSVNGVIHEVSDDDADDDRSSSDEEDETLESPITHAVSNGTTVETDLYPLPQISGPVKRRTDILPSNGPPPSILSFVRKNIGKDLSTISMPVTSNEPLTLLEKYSEMFEYCKLLNTLVASEIDSGERILYIAVFATSYLSSLRVKERNNRKPFNPLLGETYEMVREDLGMRLISEKVSHRPQIYAMYADSEDWAIQYAPSPDQKFWSKNAEIITKGVLKLTLRKTGEVYQWSQPTSLLKNIIAGEKYTEPSSSINITSSTGHRLVVEFKQGGMFSGRSEELTINAFDKDNKQLPAHVQGTWTEELTLKLKNQDKVIWKAGKLVPNTNKKYGFTEFAASLNEITPIEEGKMSPTDSRLRPDLQNYELGNVEEAETLKLKLELDQRNRRNEGIEFKPLFFKELGDGKYEFITGHNSYWERRKRSDWEGLLKLW